MNYLMRIIPGEYIGSVAIQVFLLSICGLLFLHVFGKKSASYRSSISSCLIICLGLLLVFSPIRGYLELLFFKINIRNNAVSVLKVFGIIWVLGTIFMLGKLILSLSFLKGFKTATAHTLDSHYTAILKEVTDKFDFPNVPNVYSSFAVESPITVGIFRISVIIPQNLLESMNDDEFRSVLYHEFAHIYHRDHIFGVFQQIIIAFNWWNPLVYQIAAKHTLAREEISDSYAIKGVKSAKLYAETLVNLAEKVCLISKFPATAGMASKYFDLKKRVSNILEREEDMEFAASRKVQALLGVTILVVSVFIAGSGVVLAEPSENVIVKNNSNKGDNIIQVAQLNTETTDTAKPVPVEVSPPAVEKVVVAVNPLSASGELAREEQIISDIMQAELSVSENITLVDRDNLRKALKELQLAQQGMISPESAKKLGKIVGAKYFCSGKVTKSRDKTMAIVKIVDVETTITKLAYSTLKSKDDAIVAGQALASNIEKLIANFTDEKAAIAKKIAAENKVKPIPDDWKRPVVMVIIPEMHVNQRVIDPAAETELIKRLIDDKYKVVDSGYVTMMRNDPSNATTLFSTKKTAVDYAAKKGVDLLIYGEAISELGARLGEFEGCRARVEIKAIKVDGDEILLSDSAYGGATDLAESTAGKKALQKAANRLADHFNYQLAEKWNKK